MTLLKVHLLYRHCSGHTAKNQLSGRITDIQIAIVNGTSRVKITGGTSSNCYADVARSDGQFQGCICPTIRSEGLRNTNKPVGT
jgi:hypothetical protein